MFFRSLRIQILWRLILLLIAGLASLYLAFFTPFWLSAIWTGLAFAFLFWSLLRLLERRHRHLEQFLQAISQADFSQQSLVQQDPMAPLYSQVRELFGQLRSEKASQHTYLQQVVEHVDIAMIGFDGEGKVSLINQAARSLLKKPYLHQIQSLATSHPTLWQAIQQLEGREQKLIEIELNGMPRSFSLRTTDFKLLDQPYHIISFQDISRELQTRELDAWEKLIRVITHEITNSVIPIATLAQIAEGMVETDTPLDKEDQQDLKESLSTIARRSHGLADFVGRYKKLARLPAPMMEVIRLGDMLEEVIRLMEPQFDEGGIELEYAPVPQPLFIYADREQLVQVLINLLRNALDVSNAKANPFAKLTTKLREDNQVEIDIQDNGDGIPTNLQARIFVPFFTTKEHGSGIGLSLARQIIWRHNGQLGIAHTGPNGTTMRITMPLHQAWPAAPSHKTSASGLHPDSAT